MSSTLRVLALFVSNLPVSSQELPVVFAMPSQPSPRSHVEVEKIKEVAVDLPEYIEKAMQAKLAEVRLELQHDSEAMVVKALQKQQEALEMTQADLRQTKQELAEWKT